MNRRFIDAAIYLLTSSVCCAAAPPQEGPEKFDGDGFVVSAPSDDALHRAVQTLQPLVRRFTLHFGACPELVIDVVPSLREATDDDPRTLNWFDRDAFLQDPERHAAAVPDLGAIVESVESPGTVRVATVVPRSMAASSPLLRSDDVVLHVDGEPIHAARDFAERVRSVAPGQELGIRLLRNGDTIDVVYSRTEEVNAETKIGVDAEAMRRHVLATTPTLARSAARRFCELWRRQEALQGEIPAWLSEGAAGLLDDRRWRASTWERVRAAEGIGSPLSEVLAGAPSPSGEPSPEADERFREASLVIVRLLLLEEGAPRLGPLFGELLGMESAELEGKVRGAVSRLPVVLRVLGRWEEDADESSIRLRVLPDRVLASHFDHDEFLAITGIGGDALRAGDILLRPSVNGERLEVDLPWFGPRDLLRSLREVDDVLTPYLLPPTSTPSPADVEDVRARIGRLVEEDQAARTHLSGAQEAEEPSAAEALLRLRRTDRECSQEFLSILEAHGWLDGEIFGRAAVADAWLLSHHSGDLRLQLAVLPHLREEVGSGALASGCLELFEDRLVRRLGGPLLAADVLDEQGR